tara:strand:- start:453 stop:1127 length:675 start_codon:yes stop_codon:yes gene_type:complete
MSLIDQASASKNPHKPRMAETAGTVENPKIIQTTEFMSQLRGVLENNVLDKKTQKQWKDYRHRLKKAHWPLEGLTNKVDGETWKTMCEAVLTSMVKHINNSQPNGEWKLGEYEIDIRPDANGNESIVIACKWIDANNAHDLRYQNGVPAVDVNINMADSNKELIEAISKKQDDSNDDELKELMKQFIATMAGKAVEEAKKDEPADAPTVAPAEDIDDLAEDFEG